MLRAIEQNRCTYQGNWQSFASYQGADVTPGSGSKGSWVQLVDTESAANPIATRDAYGLMFTVHGNTTVTSRPTWLDIGYDPNGGSSYTVVVPDMQVGGGAFTNYTTMGRMHYFPMFFKAGGTIAFRLQSVNTSVCRIGAQVFTAPSNPANTWVGQYAETIGTTSGAKGTNLTLGNNAYGSWTSIGTTTRNLKYFQLGVHCDNTVMTSQGSVFDLAYGDGTNFTPIISNMRVGTITTEEFYNHVIPPELCYRDVPAGSTLYVRGGSQGVPNTGWHASATGLGG